MKTIKLGRTGMDVPVLAHGCMRLADAERKQAAEYFRTALDLGLNFFDHADIYAGGRSEEVFADLVRESGVSRDKLIIQSKCGIVPGKMYDFSKAHILNSVDGILKRLNTDYLDVLLLHRPDALMEPEEVAEAFDALEAAGKVRHFGVSNEDPNTLALLQKYVRQPIAADQLQLSVTNASMIEQPMNMNIGDDRNLDRDNGVLNYCRLHDITIQTWSPFQYGFMEGVFLGSEKFAALNKVLEEVGARYGVSSTTISLAWILRHPAKMQAVVGSINPKRIIECAKAAEIELSRADWYEIYRGAGHRLP